MRSVVRPLDDDGAGLAVNVAPRVVGPVLNDAQPAGCARNFSGCARNFPERAALAPPPAPMPPLPAAAGLGVNVVPGRGWPDHSEVEPTNRNKLGLKSVHRGVRTCDGKRTSWAPSFPPSIRSRK